MRTSLVGMLAGSRTGRKFVLFIVLLITVLSGCSSVISTSENFYKDRPPRRINWREYLTD
jgi:predicted component of type VI protein secretion system